MADFPRSEVEAHFARWRTAIDQRDLAACATMLAEDARGGNSVFGISEGRTAVLAFMERWPESVPNRSLWVAIDGVRVVNKWREFLPASAADGSAADGSDYHYDGISEFHYAGDGLWSFMYGLPDLAGLQQSYARWKRDGHEATHGVIYPGL